MRALSTALGVLIACGCGGGGGGGPDAATDQIAPAVSSSVPANGATGVWLHDPITVTFSEEVTADSVDADAISLRAGDTLLPIRVELGADRRTAVITVEPGAAAVGDLTLALTSNIFDLASNRLAPATIAWTVPPWQRPVGVPGAAPAIVADETGLLVAAQVGAAGARRIAVQRLEAGAWTALGELGTVDAVAPAIALDGNGAPVVAWVENPGGAATVEAARWTDGAWAPLPSPGAMEIRPAVGAGQAPVVLAPSLTPVFHGQVAIAWATGATSYAIHVRELDGTTWRPLGDPVPGGAVVAPPVLVSNGPSSLSVAVLAAQFESPGRFPSQRIAVHTWDGAAWTAHTPLASGLAAGDLDGITEDGEVAPRVSLSSGTQLTLAWDQRELGNASVFAAIADGVGWRRLGGALNIDPGSEATSPVVIAAQGGAMVAWRERIDGRERGVAARWTDPTWTAIGEPWNGDALRPIAPALLTWKGAAPIVAWQRDGGIGVARFNGPSTPGPGLDERASSAGCALGAAPPAELADTGCFDIDSGTATPNIGLVPYDVVVEGWTDGSLARRWLALPDGAALTPTAGAWTAPVGAIAIQELAIESTPGDAATRRPVETRFLERTADGWRALSYQWRDDASGAALLAGDAAVTHAFPRGSGTYTHLYPSRAECRQCHNDGTGPLVGVRSAQLARRVDYGPAIADQLVTLAHIGAVTGDPSATAMVSPADPSQTFELRMRGYLAANCADCHAPGGGAAGDYRWETAFDATGLCDVMSPGDASSDLLARVRSRSATAPRGMPPVGTRIFDTLGVHVVGKWIADAPATLCP
jgi:hypothetical protein